MSEVGHVQGSGVLGISAAQDVAVGIETKQVGHVAADLGEIGDGAVVHEDMTAEDKRVAIDLCHDAATSRADVGEQAVGLGIAAEIAEVEVADRWGLRFVQGRSLTVYALDIILRRLSVPCYAEAVHVK